MAIVKQDKVPNILHENFEDIVSTLLPADPVSKKQVKGSKHRAEISSMNLNKMNQLFLLLVPWSL